MNDIAGLNSQFGIPGIAAIEAGQGGLARVAVSTNQCAAHVYLHGAHVTHFQVKGQEPLLFMSGKSHFTLDKPIRGGVPICFPWFGPKANDPAAPIHGFARLLPWELTEIKQLADGSVNVVLELKSSEATRARWPFDFTARYQVNVGAAMELTLRITNRSPQPFTFEEALHTYLAVGDVRRVRIDGLAGARFIDKMDSAKQKTQPGPITIEAETDRAYLNTAETVAVHDPALGRQLRIQKQGSQTTVVWNPWIDKARAMADFGDEEWPRMLCIETANAAADALGLAPGATHEMRAVISSGAAIQAVR